MPITDAQRKALSGIFAYTFKEVTDPQNITMLPGELGINYTTGVLYVKNPYTGQIVSPNDVASLALHIADNTEHFINGVLKDANGNELLKLTTVASAVNELTVSNAITGTNPSISATGDDANIGINLVPKGTGWVTAGGVELVSVSRAQTLSNKTLTAPKFVSGGFLADDSGNELLKFTKVASAVNELTIVNAATTVAPEIQATGGDTNISIKLTPKGTGNVLIGTSKVWHEGNDGTGSTLDADLLDGKHSTAFAELTGANFSGAVALVGTQLTVQSDGDHPIYWKSLNGTTEYGYIGRINSGTSDYIGIKNTVAGKSFMLYDDGSLMYGTDKVWHAGNDGATSGLDADLLDSMQSATAATNSTIAARDSSGNLTANNFIGVLQGAKKIDNTNQINLINGFAGGVVYENYTGATAAITEHQICNGMNTGVLVKLTALSFKSTVAQGTAPFEVNSTTMVNGLNAQYLNGKSAPSGDIVGLTDTQILTNKTLTSPILTTPKFANAGYIADANGNELIIFNTAANAINELSIINAAANGMPSITTTGGDTNISMNLVPKGTGWILAGGVELVSISRAQTLTNKTLTAPKFASGGYLADANGNELLIFTTVASAVNELTLANAATAGMPTLSATGGDTNISIKLLPKGTGEVYVNAYKIWHQGNDGAGSGLDADTLDGKHASEIVSTGGATFTGNITMSASDLVYRSDVDNGVVWKNAADTQEFGSAKRINSAVTDYMSFMNAISGLDLRLADDGAITYGTNKIWHEGNDGSGSGLDADLLDNMQPATAATNSTIAARDATGNLTANNFIGVLQGAKKIDSTNQINLVNGFTGGVVYQNYNGATSAITELQMCNGMNAGVLVKLTALTFKSTVAQGTAPFEVTSTSVVNNLNAQYLNGKSAPSGDIVGISDTQTLTNKTLTSPTLTSPKFASGGYIADANGNELLIFNTTTNAINELSIMNAAAGSMPTISASGGDTNISIAITPKGTGRLNLNGAGISMSGSIFDSSVNELLKFTSIASATNEITIANAATGAGPTLSVTGSSDPNVDLNISPKGTGKVNVTSALQVAASSAPLKSTFNATTSNSTNIAALLKTKTSGDAVDGYGVSLGFAIEDSSATEYTIARIGAMRSNNLDTSGDLVFATMNSGSMADRVRITYDGKLLVGVTSSSEMFEVAGDAKIAGSGSDIAGSTLANAALLIGATLGLDANEIAFSTNGYIETIGSYDLYFRNGTSELLKLGYDGTHQLTGKLGINTVPTADDLTASGSIKTTYLKVGSILDLNGKSAISLTAVNNAVNYINVANEITGNAPRICSYGSDDNINLDLLPKGTGKVRVAQDGFYKEVATIDGTQILSGKTLVAPKILSGGYIADDYGTEVLKFTAVASAVNEVTVSNAATGTAPKVQASGDDTDIDLEVKGKGAGKVKTNALESAGDVKGATISTGSWIIQADPVTGSLKFMLA